MHGRLKIGGEMVEKIISKVRLLKVNLKAQMYQNFNCGCTGWVKSHATSDFPQLIARLHVVWRENSIWRLIRTTF